ncbi:MAG: sugar ABC transporter permease [Eubacteriales bacterium]|nr:sugar ABC transporter permease [Eubacteriales bacterium]MDD3882678.1 sugar ABC transporter permease [Eubacteriales bacterium]MDD4512750.1 sugar ABC transporter permease [Eubacteriales bacterium]
MAKKKHVRTMRSKNAVTGYLFILPFIIGFLMFMLKPMAQSLMFSFEKVTPGLTGFTETFVGIQNYKFALTGDPDFPRFLVEEIGTMVTNSLATLVLSFVIAVFLNQKFKGRTFVRAVFFLPVILSSGVLFGLETNNDLMQSISTVANESGVNLTGTLEDILRLSGIGTRAFSVVFEIINGVYDIIMASGIQIIVFLSGLQTISPSMYEAADMEGCSRWESFWKITFPMVSPLLLVNCIYTIIDFFMKSDSENGVLDRISEVMLANLDYGLSAAMSWIYFGVAIALIGITSFIISKGVHYYE